MEHHKTVISIAFVLAFLTAESSGGQQPFFTGLGAFSLPDDVSADGRVVVGGSSSTAGPVSTFRWTRETGMIDLGVSDIGVQQVSADGSTVITWGSTSESTQSGAYRWTSANGLVPLPIVARGVSGNGSVIVGHPPGGGGAARWSEANGVEFLPILDGYSSEARDISADGSVILGVAFPIVRASWQLFTWSAADGIVWLNLASPFSGDDEYIKISDNGIVVTGNMGDNAANRRGFRWTNASGAIEIPRLPDGRWMSANGASADGSIIVGNSQNVSPQRPAIWDAIHGSRYLDNILVEELGLGPAMTGWSQLLAKGVSGDGRSVIGYGTNPNGRTEAWIAYLGAAVPEPSSLGLALLTIALTAARVRPGRAVVSTP